MSSRRTFSPEFKAAVVLSILKGEKSTSEICREHKIKETVIGRWKQQFLENASVVFGQSNTQNQDAVHTAELERMVGRLTMEVDILKKASSLLNSSKGIK
jgi:transposase